MKLNKQKPRNFINPLLSRKSVDTEKFNAFKLALEHYKKSLASQISTKQTEPNIVASTLKPFLDSFGYQSEPYSQKGQISIDLAVMQNLKPSVIIEAKMPNSADMIWESDLNKKAFQQAIMYFMNERAKDNKALFHIIITDFNNWFVFDAKDFDRHFWRNATIKNLYDAYTSKSLLGDTTGEFYQALERELPKLKKDLLDAEEIDCAHFNVQLPANEKEYIAIYKLLSADCLLKEFNPNDANSLNREFYTELLYILGLEESKEGGKKIIGKAKNPQNGTLYENISNKLAQYNKPNDFESVIKLIIIWVNRILFLKLLESQIVKWTGKQDYKFLNPNTLDQYDALETLFFEVLAKPIDKRNVRDFDHIPYLNSSLFEIHPDENNGIKLSNLVDGLTIDYYAKTVVKDANKLRKTGKASTLPYFLAFLDAFDFANDSDEELVSQSKSLISASVLGLIFEKINGYKDGSFYTPSFITMYMARETITKTVIEKFNESYGWQCKTLTDLHNKDLDIAEANTLINSIKICDPAVGSGHFLVSALNEILRIKSELGVLVDEVGKRIKDYSLSIENDDLIIKSNEGELFEYKKNDFEKTRIQKTLFKEKQLLIENCLFGVDINPNSVNICRLRLWIELLKNAYYKVDNQLDTLPNIDINIKCGNSLISRFGLADDLDSKTIKAEIQDYKQKVAQYKENIGSKRDVLQSIDAIKAKFQEKLKSGHAVTKILNLKLTEYVKQFSFDGLSKELEMIAFIDLGLRGKQAEMFAIATNEKSQDNKLKEVNAALNKKQEIESGKIYENAFEWRFEFPEVLNEQGDFVGFDVVIGNPPYISLDGFSESYRSIFREKFEQFERKYETSVLFIVQAERLLKQSGCLSYISPPTWQTGENFRKFRAYLCSNLGIQKIINLPFNVFEDAYVDTGIYVFNKSKQSDYFLYNFEKKDVVETLDIVNFEKFLSTEIKAPEFKIVFDKSISAMQSKFDSDGFVDLGSITRSTQGLSGSNFSSCNISDEFSKPFLEKGNVYNYMLLKESVHLTSLKNHQSLIPFYNKEPKILIRRIINRQDRLSVGYCDEELVFKKDINPFICTNDNFDTFFVLGLLASKFISALYLKLSAIANKDDFRQTTLTELRRLPIPKVDFDKQQPIINKVNAIITAKQYNNDTSRLEAEVDALVYALYGLSDDEIKLIEGLA